MRSFDLKGAAEVLEGLGYDVVVGDGEVSARRDDVVGVWTLYLDRGGRVRFVATRLDAIPKGRRVRSGEHVFKLLRETQETITVLTDLSSPAEIPGVLEQIAHWVEEFSQGGAGGGEE